MPRPIFLLALFLMTLLMGCVDFQKVKSNILLIPTSYLKTLPGSLIYDVQHDRCERKGDLCVKRKFLTGEYLLLTSSQMARYNNLWENMKNINSPESPDGNYKIEWLDVASEKHPAIVNQKTRKYHFLALDDKPLRSGYVWSPDSQHVIYALEDYGYGDSGAYYVFILQNVTTGKAYLLFEKAQGNIELMWMS